MLSKLLVGIDTDFMGKLAFPLLIDAKLPEHIMVALDKEPISK